ncbi:ribosome maturation factor RimM [Pollutimonas harenae]|uniref:Ribosome maturation factor RimM n=1 Tax=Pollutimonas harenae TaxID=657015 RepID=A0A853GRR5_9BURK|nr:ribosome maturation factor RimM [Pollutimonas harenae]NYT85778.1 ribosome maturation factor RimM [Pollutimonas harenae]TEA70843.1 ribosome maturation factor RimM [Pollutimonas harenae]
MSTSTTLPSQAPTDLVELGRVVSAYGVRGWVKIQPHSSNGQVLLKAKTWWLKAPTLKTGLGASALVFATNVAASRPQGATVVAQLDVVADRDQAEALKGHTVWVPRAEFPPAEDDEYYWVDLIGCRLFGEHDGQSALIGQVLDVVDNGAHAVLRVARAEFDAEGDLVFLQSSKGKSIEVLVPFVAAHVHTVDLAARRLDSDWPVEL